MSGDSQSDFFPNRDGEVCDPLERASPNPLIPSYTREKGKK